MFYPELFDFLLPNFVNFHEEIDKPVLQVCLDKLKNSGAFYEKRKYLFFGTNFPSLNFEEETTIAEQDISFFSTGAVIFGRYNEVKVLKLLPMGVPLFQIKDIIKKYRIQ
jgi:hypothetical protein